MIKIYGMNIMVLKRNEWKNVPDHVTEDMTGFVYEITELDTGMKYIGIKQFWKRIKRKPLKGKKRVRIDHVESDWRTYKTSSPIIQEKLDKCPNLYEKEILRVCYSISEMKAFEAYYQLKYYVTGRWSQLYNEVINIRIRVR